MLKGTTRHFASDCGVLALSMQIIHRSGRLHLILLSSTEICLQRVLIVNQWRKHENDSSANLPKQLYMVSQ